eukprot:CAMPEP_0197242388 /NCGR_PEP_ID=MMETSP1429-20130617/8156_1 /TAXON_ID=49237 /ORGANISM="Chaetoceros  sp., Strain UNC1202" /LENGTH=173 /DNA_ID=CAMNT_0042702415 /DNA_START=76 /DNA_END=597 /DNA_ORIENTATION=+
MLPKRPTTNRKGMIVTDKKGTPITVFDGASYALTEINKWRKDKSNPKSSTSSSGSSGSNKGNMNSKMQHVKVAVASCTDEPGYARRCMDWLIVDDGSTLSSCFDHVEIRPGDKKNHFASLQRITGIPYEMMLFFDDYDLNIDSVSSLGVKCVHTPSGMTRERWEEGLSRFNLN